MNNQFYKKISVCEEYIRKMKLYKEKHNYFLYVIFIIFLLPFIRQRTMEAFPVVLETLIDLSSIAFASVIYIITICNRRIIARIKRTFPILLFMAMYLLTTLISDKSAITQTGKNVYILLALSLFIDREVNDNPKLLFNSLGMIYAFYIILNNILVVIFPSGFYKTSSYHSGHLLGDDNAIAYVALPGIVIVALRALFLKRKIDLLSYVCIFSTFIILVKLWAVSGMVCVCLFFVMLLFSFNLKPISAKNSGLFVAFMCVTLLYGTTSPIITKIVVNVFHKSPTFSYRTYWWAHGIKMFHESPLYGYGGYFANGASSLGEFSYPVHTTYLQILVDGGLILLVSYVILYFYCASHMDKNKESCYSQVLNAGITCMSISYIFEWSQYYHLMILFPIILNIQKLPKFQVHDIKKINVKIQR